MSAVVRRALPLLKVLVDARPKLKKAIIKHAPTELVTAISEIVLNLIKGVIKLTAHQKKRLSRYKKELLALAKKKVSLVVLARYPSNGSDVTTGSVGISASFGGSDPIDTSGCDVTPVARVSG